MAVELAQLTASFEKLWPLSGAEDWDTPGLVTGNPSQRVSRVLLTVDVTSEIITESIDGEFDLVLAHHPYLLRGVNSLAESFAKGATLSNAIRAGVSIFSAHTNADGTFSHIGVARLRRQIRVEAAKQGQDLTRQQADAIAVNMFREGGKHGANLGAVMASNQE